jgi:hypothetical protein
MIGWAVLGITHFILCVVCGMDLFKTSKRDQKSLWMFFLITIPFVSAFLYRQTMKRKKSQLLL